MWIAAALSCLGAGALIVLMLYTAYTEDRTPPVIQIPGHEIIYTEGDSEKALLKEIRATDSRDGDVSGSLIVESIYPDKEGGFATVVYVARDSSNNVAKKKVVVTYVEGTEDEMAHAEGDGG